MKKMSPLFIATVCLVISMFISFTIHAKEVEPAKDTATTTAEPKAQQVVDKSDKKKADKKKPTRKKSKRTSRHLIIPQLGMVSWTDDSNHSIDNSSFDFKDDIAGAVGVKYLWRMQNGLAFGADIYGYTKDLAATNGQNGDARIGHYYAVAQYFFNNTGTIKPYLGGGLGGVNIELEGSINKKVSGPSYQLTGGIEFAFSKRLGMIIEYKYFSMNVDEEVNNVNSDLKTNGHAIFTGLTISF